MRYRYLEEKIAKLTELRNRGGNFLARDRAAVSSLKLPYNNLPIELKN